MSIGKIFSPSLDWESSPGLLGFWSDRAYGFWVACTFLLMQIGLGHRICQSFSSLKDYTNKGISSFFGYFTLGSFLVYTLLLLASLLGFFCEPWGFFLVALVLLAGFVEIFFLMRRFQLVLIKIPYCRKFFVLLGLVFIGYCFFPYLIQTLLPNSEWDSAAYHIYIAKRLLYEGFWQTEPMLPHYNFCGGMNLFYALFLKIEAESAILPFQLFMLVLCIVLVYEIGIYFWNQKVALWASLVLAANNILWEISLTYRIDSLQAFYATIAIFALLRWIQDCSKTGHWIFCSAALGMTLGIKYTGVFLLLPMVAVTIWNLRKRYHSAKAAFFYAHLFSGIFLVLFPSGLWYLRNAIELKNPFYDYLSGPVYSNSQGKIERLNPALESFIKKNFTPERLEFLKNQTILGLCPNIPSVFEKRTLLSFWNIVLHPELHTRQPYHWVNPLLVLFLVLPFFHRNSVALLLYSLVLSTLIIPACMTYLVRYILFLFPAFSVGVALIIASLRRKFFGIFFACFSITVLLFNSHAEWKKLEKKFCYRLFLGQESRLGWLCKVGFDNSKNMPQTICFINDFIRKDPQYKNKTLLMLMEAKGDGLLCPYIPDISFVGKYWLCELIRTQGDFDRIVKNFREKNIQWLYMDLSFTKWALRESQVNRDALTVSLFFLEQFLQKYGQEIHSWEDRYIFKIF